MYIIIGGLNIGNFSIKLPIAKVYSLPIFYLIQYHVAILFARDVVRGTDNYTLIIDDVWLYIKHS